MTQDSVDILTQKMATFQDHLNYIHSVMQATAPLIEDLRTALALQWFLGNLFIVLTAGFGVFCIVYFNRQAKKHAVAFRFNLWYTLSFSVVTAFLLFAFNALPRNINSAAYAAAQQEHSPDKVPDEARGR